MTSKTFATEMRRSNKRKKGGKVRKAANRNKGTTKSAKDLFKD
jgi:hypothetical protein